MGGGAVGSTTVSLADFMQRIIIVATVTNTMLHETTGSEVQI